MSDEARERAERVSALMDGELQGDDFVRTVEQLETCASTLEVWDTYHLVGEVLRSGQLLRSTHHAEFMARLRERLAAEATDRPTGTERATAYVANPTKIAPPANDDLWRRVAGLASIIGVGLLIWQAQGWFSAESVPHAAVIAQLPAQRSLVVPPDPVVESVAPDETPIMLRDPQLDALLAAHRQHGGVTALQMPAGFLRNATFSEGGR